LDAKVVTSFLGVGAYDVRSPRSLGYIGHTGHLAANRAVFESDFLLVLGSRLDVRQTGTVLDKFVPRGDVAWIDFDRNELDNPRVKTKWQLHLEVGLFSEVFLDRGIKRKQSVDSKWVNEITELKKTRLDDQPKENTHKLQPRNLLDELDFLIGSARVTIVTGVGCHQHWAARHLSFSPSTMSLLTSGGHGTMGYDLPTAIGAAMAQAERKIICIVGDGSLLMNIQELASLRERNLNVKILVFNNQRLGIVSQFQLITWGDDPMTGDFKSPDFVTIARGFGISSDRLDKAADVADKLKWLWSQPGPALLDVGIDPDADITPMLLAGQTMGEMWMGSTS
jgi:acetolactate synthase I/II/III large subunit